MSENVIKALHLIFMVTWFSGLFYIVRLFVYHREAEGEEEFSRRVLVQQYKLMEKRLWYGITWPSMVLTTFFGFWLLVENPPLLGKAYMHLKLGMVFLLILYHILNHILFDRFQKDRNVLSGFKLRVWNEGVTLFLVSIVFTVVLGNSIDWKWGAFGILIFALALYLAILLYRRVRKKKESGGEGEQKNSDPGNDVAKR